MDKELREKLSRLRCRYCELWWGGECHSSILPKELTCGHWLADEIITLVQEAGYRKADVTQKEGE